MSDRPDLHPDELLQELLDDRLQGESRAAVEAHLASCQRCQRLRDSLLAARRIVREAPTEASANELDALLARAIERGRADPAALPPWRRHRFLVGAAAAALVIAFGALVLPSRWAAREAVDELLTLHTAASPVFGERTPEALEARLAPALPFRVRVLDLAAMDVQLVGGGTARVAGSPAGWMLYRGPAGERLLCVMFRGRLQSLPPAEETRTREPFIFRIYRRGGRTVVLWQEGKLVCALVGEGDPEGVIALAQAKAMLPVG